MRWTEAFAQLGNTQVESRFADHRTYLYEGKEVDQQTHLGFDLRLDGSRRRSPPPTGASSSTPRISASTATAWSSTTASACSRSTPTCRRIDVKDGDTVEKGQTLGRSGTTGLAGGDHLHFTMLVGGVQVNPVEWWDGHWMEDRVFRKIREAGGTAPTAAAK